MLVVAYLLMLLPISLVFSWIERRLPLCGFGLSGSSSGIISYILSLGVTIGISIVRFFCPFTRTLLGLSWLRSLRLTFLVVFIWNLFVSCPSWSCSLLFILVWLSNINNGRAIGYYRLALWERLRDGDLVRGSITLLPRHQFEKRKGPWLDQWATIPVIIPQ